MRRSRVSLSGVIERASIVVEARSIWPPADSNSSSTAGPKRTGRADDLSVERRAMVATARRISPEIPPGSCSYGATWKLPEPVHSTSAEMKRQSIPRTEFTGCGELREFLFRRASPLSIVWWYAWDPQLRSNSHSPNEQGCPDDDQDCAIDPQKPGPPPRSRTQFLRSGRRFPIRGRRALITLTQRFSRVRAIAIDLEIRCRDLQMPRSQSARTRENLSAVAAGPVSPRR